MQHKNKPDNTVEVNATDESQSAAVFVGISQFSYEKYNVSI